MTHVRPDDASGTTPAHPTEPHQWGRTLREIGRLLAAARRLSAAAEAATGDTNLTVRQTAVLAALAERESLTVAGLAATAGTTPQAVGGLLFALQNQHLVRRRPPPQPPTITPHGRAVARQAAAALAAYDTATAALRPQLARLAEQAEALTAEFQAVAAPRQNPT